MYRVDHCVRQSDLILDMFANDWGCAFERKELSFEKGIRGIDSNGLPGWAGLLEATMRTRETGTVIKIV